MAHLVFVSLFLGLVSGKQMVELQADPAIKSIRILLADQEVARLTQPPWRQSIDLGPQLLPRQLAAIGYGENGNEIARTSQVLNLPRPPAEIEFVRQGNSVQLRWGNLQYKPPRKASVTYDGKRLAVNRDFRVELPKGDDTRPHVIEAELHFDDGVVARREAVIDGSVFSDTAETQLTPVVIREISKQHPASYEGCFSAPVAAVEDDGAQVIFVKDPDTTDVVRAIDPAGRAWNPMSRRELARLVHLDEDTTEEVLWPYTQDFQNGKAVAHLFEHTAATKIGLIALLTSSWRPGEFQKAKYADAVAVAGVRALTGARRRAVVFVLNEEPDSSHNDPREVRRYLDAIGVPFFVWAAAEPSAGAVERWGPVEDISTIDHLRDATAKLKSALASQRVAWLRTDALSALRVKVDERCGFAR